MPFLFILSKHTLNAPSWLVIFQQGFPCSPAESSSLVLRSRKKTHWSSGLKAKRLCKQEKDTKITSPSGYEQQHQTVSSSWIWRSWRRGWLRERERERGIAEVSCPSVRLWCRWPSTSLPLSLFHFLCFVFLCAHPAVRELKQIVHLWIKIQSLFTYAHAVLFGTDQSLKDEGEQIIHSFFVF